ncbi:S-layer homology domain-containing protein [Paenibacillus hamazuiensis]|uniref:S-layer homology domain-containing protein n=1 Tax=Paenibacillus hamazuiensis TaxID=2936508 RepID=UPI00200D769A|nr:S-layer homology domain-containing protein [Paenibacillus hamazuiensis]
MIKKWISAGLSVLLSLSSAAGIIHAAGEEKKMAMNNDFVAVSVHKDTGRFSVSTKEGSPLRDSDSNKPLLFEHKVPETSFTTFRINGKDYIYGNPYGFLGTDGSFTYSPVTQGLTNQSVWHVAGLTITQTITLSGDSSNPNVGNVKIAYKVKNTSAEDASVGSRILLDTMLGADDASPLMISGGSQYIQKETVLDNLPAYWKAVDDPLAPKVISYGLLSGWGNESPDRMIVAHWNGISDTKWEYAVNPELDFTSKYNKYETADSAVALYWNPAVLKGGEERSYETYYGLGSFFTSLQKAAYNLQIFSPEKLTLNAAKDGYNEQIFTIQAELDNANANARALTNVAATVRLPQELDFADGEKATKSLAAVGVGETKSLSWQVKARPQQSLKAARYQLSVQAQGEEEILQTDYVILPALRGQQPSMQVLDISPKKLYMYDNRKSIAVKGTGYEALKGSAEWQVQLIRERDQYAYTIPIADITINDDKSMSIPLNDAGWTGKDKLEPGSYKLRISTGSYGSFEKSIELTTDEKYKSRSYGILLVVGDGESYDAVPVENEAALARLKGQYQGSKRILLELRGEIKELAFSDGRAYELQPGTSVNSVLRFDTNSDLKKLYGEQSQRMVVQKQPRDLAHGGDYISITGNGMLSIPSFPFVFGDFSIEMEDGEHYSLEANEDAGETPIEIVWSAFKSVSVIQQMDFFPVKIKNAVIGDKSVSFGGSLSLDFGMFQDKKKNSSTGGSPSGNGSRGSGGGGGQTGSKNGNQGNNGNGSQGSGGEEEDEEDDDDDSVVSVSVDEARFGIRPADDPFGRRGSYGLLGLRAEGEAGLPKDLVPGMDLGASGRIAIDTFDRKYEIEANVQFQVVELNGLFTLRFTGGNIPVPDNFVFVVGAEPGIPLVPPSVVAYINKGGGGFRNLYDTVTGNFNVLPPLQLVMVGGFDISKVVKGDNLTLQMSMRGIEFSGELEIAKFKLLKEVYGSISVEDSLEKFGVSLKAGAKLEVFDVITGEVYAVFAFDSSKHGLFGPVSLAGGGKIEVQVPKKIPIIGGLALAGGEGQLSTEQVYAKVHFLQIPISFKYIWGDSMPKLASSRAEDLFLEPQGIGRKVYFDEATGEPTGTLIFGSNIRRIAESGARYASSDFRPSAILADASQMQHTIHIGNQEIALLELTYSGAVPNVQVTDPAGRPYALQENENFRVQEIPADVSESGTLEQKMYVSVVNPQSGDWKVVSDRPIQSALLNVAIPPSLKSVSAETTGDHKVRVSWQGDHVQDEKVSLYISENNEKDPGHLLTEGLDVNAGAAELTLPSSLPTGSYYIRAVVSKDGTNYDSRYSTNTVQVTDPYQPAAPSAVTAAPVGDGVFHVQWSMNESADGYYIQLLDAAGQPVQGAGVIDVKGDQREAYVGGVFVDQTGRQIGMKPGVTYQVAVTAYKSAEGRKHFSGQARSIGVYLPEPSPAKLTISLDAADGPFQEAYDEQGRLYYLVNRSSVQVKVHSDQTVTMDMLAENADLGSVAGTDRQEAVTLKEGANMISVRAVNEHGDSSAAGIKIVADTAAPELKLESPGPGVMPNDNGTILVKGMAEADSRVTVNGKQVDVGESGIFTADLQMTGYMKRHLNVTAEDAAGNRSVYEADVTNGKVETFDRVEIHPASSGNGSAGTTGGNGGFVAAAGGSQPFRLVGIDAAGEAYVIDNADVAWSVLAGDSYGRISGDGVLEAKQEGDIVLKAAYNVSQQYALEDALTVKVRASLGGGPGQLPSSDYGGWYKPSQPDLGSGSDGDSDSDSPSGGGSAGSPGTSVSNDNIPVKEAGTPKAGANDFEQMIKAIIENERNVQFIKSAFLSPEQDTVITIDERTELTLPKMNTKDRVGLGIGRIKNPSAYESGTIKVMGSMYEFKFDKPIRLTQPARLKVRFDPAGTVNVESLAIYWYNERSKRWEYVGGELDPASHTVTARLKHFSKYALLSNSGLPEFADMKDRWSSDHVNRLASIGVVNGVSHDGRNWYEPERSITRQELVKLLAGVAGTVATAGSLAESGFADAGDVQAWAQPYMAAAIDRGWITGTSIEGRAYLEPERPITRAEAAAVAGRMLQEVIRQSDLSKLPFSDEPALPDWSKPYIGSLFESGILDGYPDGTFRANNPISREEAAAIIGKMLDLLYDAGREIR